MMVAAVVAVVVVADIVCLVLFGCMQRKRNENVKNEGKKI